MNSSTDRVGYVYAGVAIGLWAGFILVSRVGGTGTLSPWDIAALRFGTAAIVLAPAWIFLNRVPLFTSRMLVLALVGGIAYALTVYAGFRHAPAAHGALLVSGLLPFTMALMVWLVLHELPGPSLRRGLVLIAAGVACLAVEAFRQGGATLLGDGLLVAASFCWALYSVLIRRWGYGPWETTIGVALLASLLYLPPYALVFPDAILLADRGEVLVQAVYQGIFVVIVAMVLYMQAMVRLGPARLGALMALVPAIGGVGASVLLAEPLAPPVVAGLVLTSIGAFIGARPTDPHPR